MIGDSFRVKWDLAIHIIGIWDGNVLTEHMSPGDPEIQKQEKVDISCLKVFF